MTASKSTFDRVFCRDAGADVGGKSASAPSGSPYAQAPSGPVVRFTSAPAPQHEPPATQRESPAPAPAHGTRFSMRPPPRAGGGAILPEANMPPTPATASRGGRCSPTVNPTSGGSVSVESHGVGLNGLPARDRPKTRSDYDIDTHPGAIRVYKHSYSGTSPSLRAGSPGAAGEAGNGNHSALAFVIQGANGAPVGCKRASRRGNQGMRTASSAMNNESSPVHDQLFFTPGFKSSASARETAFQPIARISSRRQFPDGATPHLLGQRNGPIFGTRSCEFIPSAESVGAASNNCGGSTLRSSSAGLDAQTSRGSPEQQQNRCPSNANGTQAKPSRALEPHPISTWSSTINARKEASDSGEAMPSPSTCGGQSVSNTTQQPAAAAFLQPGEYTGARPTRDGARSPGKGRVGNQQAGDVDRSSLKYHRRDMARADVNKATSSSRWRV